MSNDLQLVGVLNMTPNSFSDGGQFLSPDAALAQAKQLFADGASIVDVGGEATNPKAEPITADEEWRRIEPVLSVLVPEYPGKISVDTHHPETAEKALALGKVMLNDVTTFHNPQMRQLAVKFGCKCIVSHLPFRVQGDIRRAHREEDQLMDSIEQVRNELLVRLWEMIAEGVKAENIILDPGIGFGKTPELNRKLVEFAAMDGIKGRPVLIGYSRKRFLGDNRMEADVNVAMGKIAKASGAQYLRVHDVKAHAVLLDNADS